MDGLLEDSLAAEAEHEPSILGKSNEKGQSKWSGVTYNTGTAGV